MSVHVHDQDRAAVELRPGVFRPDWTVVTSDTVREALNARGAARVSLIERWMNPLSGEKDRVWIGVIRFFVEHGRPPQFAELAHATAFAQDRVEAALRTLGDRDLLGLDNARSAVTYAYPFAARPTGHKVHVGPHALHSLCAVDALGTAAMCGIDVTIVSRCRSCAREIRIETASGGTALRSVSPENAVIWFDLSYGDSAAASCCSNTAFFCSGDHLGEWHRGSAGSRNGRRLTMEEGLEMGRALFGPILAEPVAGSRDHRDGESLANP
jgi:alkylmercury lyase